MYWPVGIFTNSSAAQTAWVSSIYFKCEIAKLRVPNNLLEVFSTFLNLPLKSLSFPNNWTKWVCWMLRKKKCRKTITKEKFKSVLVLCFFQSEISSWRKAKDGFGGEIWIFFVRLIYVLIYFLIKYFFKQFVKFFRGWDWGQFDRRNKVTTAPSQTPISRIENEVVAIHQGKWSSDRWIATTPEKIASAEQR